MLPKRVPRLLFGLVLVLSILTHVLVAHHNSSELIFCLRANGDIAIETPEQTDHGHQHCEHEGGCHDIHLEISHADDYTSQQNQSALDALDHQLAMLLPVLSTLGTPVLDEMPLAELSRHSHTPPPQPPPEQFSLALTSTVLLI